MRHECALLCPGVGCICWWMSNPLPCLLPHVKALYNLSSGVDPPTQPSTQCICSVAA